MNDEIAVFVGVTFFIVGICILEFRRTNITVKENDKPLYMRYNNLISEAV